MVENVCKFISQFNERNRLVQTLILCEPDLKSRTKIVQKFLEICEHLVSLNNFNGILYIISALNSSPVFRLKKTFAALPVADLTAFERLSQLVDSKDNYKTLRNELQTTYPPCIPYTGMYLTDLTFLDEGNKNKTPENLINFGKCQMIGTVIQEIRHFQKQHYVIKPDLDVQHLLKSMLLVVDENVLYAFSQYCEPKDDNPRGEMPKELQEIISKREK